MSSGFELWPMEEGRQYSEYSVESNPRTYMTMRDYRNLAWQNQQPWERNPNPPRSMRDYRDQGMSAPSYMVPPQYTSTPQPPQPPQLISPVEQAILDLTKLVGDAVDEQKKFNAQLSEKIHTEENSLDQRLEGLNNDFEHEWDNLQDSIEDLIDQQQCPPEEECQSDTMVEEPCLQQPPEGLIENFESSVGVAVCLWEKKEEGKEPQGPIIQQNPIDLDPNATAQLKNNPLPVAPSADQVYILPSPAPQPTPTTNSKPAAPKAKSNPSLPVMQNFNRLVAFVQNFATTSKTMAAAHIAWHSGWFRCRFGFGALEPRHF